MSVRPYPQRGGRDQRQRPTRSLQVTTGTRGRITRLNGACTVRVRSRDVRPLNILRPILLSTVYGATTRDGTIPLSGLRMVLFPYIIVRLPTPRLLVLTLFIPVRVRDIQVKGVHIPFSKILVIQGRLFVGLVTSSLQVLYTRVLMTTSVVLNRVAASRGGGCRGGVHYNKSHLQTKEKGEKDGETTTAPPWERDRLPLFPLTTKR